MPTLLAAVRHVLGPIAALAAVLTALSALVVWDAGRRATAAERGALESFAAYAASVDATARPGSLGVAVRASSAVAAYRFDVQGAARDVVGEAVLTPGATSELLRAAGPGGGLFEIEGAGGGVLLAAVAPLPGGGHVVLVRPSPGLPALGAFPFGVGAVALLLLVCGAGALVNLGYRVQARAAARVETVHEALRAPEPLTTAGVAALQSRHREALGPLGEPVLGLLQNVVAARQAAAEGKTKATELERLVDAFFQANPHYVLLLGLDGKVVEANPAFYARTGMMPEWVRGQGGGILSGTLDTAPLLELGRRSKQENMAFTGVEFAMAGEDGKARAVQVAVRHVCLRGADCALVILSDQTALRTLERQIAAYTDALELMVDQRVAELAPASDGADVLLEAAGVVCAVFDRDGGVVRWNAPAEQLTGRTRFTVHHADDVLAHLAPGPEERQALAAWFWQATPSAPVVLDVPMADGRFGRYLLYVGAQRQGGEVSRRALVGVPVPPDLSDGAVTPDAIASDVRSVAAYAALLESRAEATGDEEGLAYLAVVRQAALSLARQTGVALVETPAYAGDGAPAAASERPARVVANEAPA